MLPQTTVMPSYRSIKNLSMEPPQSSSTKNGNKNEQENWRNIIGKVFIKTGSQETLA